MKRMCFGIARALAAVFVGTLLAARVLSAQNTGSIEGTITIAGDRPLSDATVIVVGTQRGARTDETGKFRIAGVPPGAYQVRAQRIGFASTTQTATVTANQTTTLNFSLKEAALSLDVLVVTGTAAESRKKEVGNAMATIDTKALEVQPIRNTQDILAGRAPGITVLQNSGQPGAGGTIKLRGTNSITQGTNPIIYVDGVRIYSDNGPITAGARQSSLFANDIKADDIGGLDLRRSGSGDVRVRKVHGDVHIGNVGSGDLTFEDVSKSVHVNSVGSGDVGVHGAGGDVVIDSIGSGDVTASDVGGDFVVKAAGSGDIHHHDVKGKVSVPERDDD